MGMRIYLSLLALLVLLFILHSQRNSLTETDQKSVTQKKFSESQSPSRRLRVPYSEAKPVPNRGRASHPKVGYRNPGQIRSFSEAALTDAYAIYFSLIGEHKDKYSYKESGFDTAYNAKLAFETLTSVDYSLKGAALEAQFEGVVNALMHLSHAEHETALRLGDELVGNLIERIEQNESSKERLLMEADLRTLLQTKTVDRNRMVALYHDSQDKVVRDSIGFALYLRLESGGLDRNSIYAELQKNGIPFKLTYGFGLSIGKKGKL